MLDELATFKFDLRLQQDIEATARKVKFLKLQVINTSSGSSDDEAFVRFQVWFKVVGQKRQDGAAAVQTNAELSRFLREDGKWLYVDAVDSNFEVLA